MDQTSPKKIKGCLTQKLDLSDYEAGRIKSEEIAKVSQNRKKFAKLSQNRKKFADLSRRTDSGEGENPGKELRGGMGRYEGGRKSMILIP